LTFSADFLSSEEVEFHRREAARRVVREEAVEVVLVEAERGRATADRRDRANMMDRG